MLKKVLTIFLFAVFSIFSFGADKLKVGVTLQPYYSFVTNIAGDKVDVFPVIRGDLYDSHNYQPQYEDLKQLGKADVVVVNGVGHDEFVFDMIKAAPNSKKIKIIYSNAGVSLMPVSGSRSSEKIMNAHTFISITTSIQQVYNIAKELGKLDPGNKEYYLKNAREYAKKLRKIKTDALSKVSSYKNLDFRVATMHGGYDYLLSEFGVDVKVVIEPAHGVQPSAKDLKEVIDVIKRDKIDIIFAEAAFQSKFIDTLHKETGVEVRALSHMTNGPYTKDSFEKFIQENLNSVISAMQFVAKKKGLK